jgi:hypothetical protein
MHINHSNHVFWRTHRLLEQRVSAGEIDTALEEQLTLLLEEVKRLMKYRKVLLEDGEDHLLEALIQERNNSVRSQLRR